MRVLIAADKFKGSLTAPQACDAIAAGVRRVYPDARIDLCPMSDGGEGFVETIVRACGGRLVTRRVTGPLPELKVDATFGVTDLETQRPTAVIEMSSAAGLMLVPPEERNPLYTTTFGVGELIRFAVEVECRRVILGIGGSATCDAGIGCLQACGCHIIRRSGEYAVDSEPLCGRDLDDVLMVKAHRGSRVDGVEIQIACDVTNPLTGPHGSATVYGPQKGASADDARTLDRMLSDFAARIGHSDLAGRAGSGAAGGLGFGLAAMFGATMSPGFELVASVTDLRSRIAAADLVFTGEGSIDAQSGAGKVTGGIAALCRRAGRPCIAIAGMIADPADANRLGFARVIALSSPGGVSRELAMAEAASLVADRAAQVLRPA